MQTGAARSGLTIGEFAAMTHLSVRTLRRYHEAGLLEPAAVDPFTGYRYYGHDQIGTAQVIHRLRQLDVPLFEVRAILATDDPHQRADVVAGHLRRLEAELDRTSAAVTSLRRLLSPDPADIDVELRSVPRRTVVGVCDHVRLEDSLAWYDSAMAELDAAFPPFERTGPPGGHYDNELFVDGAGQMTVFRPVRSPRASGRLGSWVATHTLAIDGPVQEIYHVGPRDTADPAAWRTEIGWPVFRQAPVE